MHFSVIGLQKTLEKDSALIPVVGERRRMALSYQYPRDVVKVIVLGATGTGKTALCNQLVNHSFQAQHQHTRTVDSYFLPMPKLCIDPTHHPDETTAVTVELVDTPGETTKPVLPMTPEARLSQTVRARVPERRGRERESGASRRAQFALVCAHRCMCRSSSSSPSSNLSAAGKSTVPSTRSPEAVSRRRVRGDRGGGGGDRRRGRSRPRYG